MSAAGVRPGLAKCGARARVCMCVRRVSGGVADPAGARLRSACGDRGVASAGPELSLPAPRRACKSRGQGLRLYLRLFRVSVCVCDGVSGAQLLFGLGLWGVSLPLGRIVHIDWVVIKPRATLLGGCGAWHGLGVRCSSPKPSAQSGLGLEGRWSESQKSVAFVSNAGSQSGIGTRVTPAPLPPAAHGDRRGLLPAPHRGVE